MQVAVGYRQRNDGFGLLPNNELRDFESHTGAIPIRLTNHLLAKGDEVLIGERGVFSFAHVMTIPFRHQLGMKPSAEPSN